MMNGLLPYALLAALLGGSSGRGAWQCILHTRPLGRPLGVLALAAAAFAAGRLRPAPRASRAATRVLADVLFPALIVRALVREPIDVGAAGVLVGGLLAVVLPLALLARPLAAALGLEARTIVLPVAFMNSGFLGIPAARAHGGEAAAAAAALYDLAMSIVIFTLGLALVGGSARAGLAEVLRAPFTWAIALGAALGAAGATLPAPVDLACGLLGGAAPPLAVAVVAHDVAGVRPILWRPAAAVAAVRIGGGALLAWLYTSAVGAEGPVRAALVLEGAMPCAVLSYILTARAGVPAAPAASALLVSTAAAAVTTPLLARILL